MNEQEQLCCLWLSQAAHTARFDTTALLRSCGSVLAIYQAQIATLQTLPFLSENACAQLIDKSLDAARHIQAVCQAEDISVIGICDPQYPASLREIPFAPPVLYARGTLAPPHEMPGIAVVGTRRMDAAGSKTAYDLSYAFARAGAIVISGMALGIDGMAHQGALDGGGYTVAVLGSGLCKIYPSQHRNLAEKICSHGLLLSEYPPFTPPLPRYFPARNRIISGLSKAVVVVQAPAGSGALRTAEYALSQGRMLFAVPGNLQDERYAGNLSLLRNGAQIVTAAQDVLPLFPALRSAYSSAGAVDLDTYSPLPRFGSDALCCNGNTRGTAPHTAHMHKVSPASSVPSKRKDAYSSENGNASVRHPTAGGTASPAAAEEPCTVILQALRSSSPNGATSTELAQQTGLSLQELALPLMQLELDGYITLAPGDRYALKKQI